MSLLVPAFLALTAASCAQIDPQSDAQDEDWTIEPWDAVPETMDTADLIDATDVPMDIPVEDVVEEEWITPPTCGNGAVEWPEECDDGNEIEGDGCDSDCSFSCHSNLDCDDGLACSDDLCDLYATHTCSNPLSSSAVMCRTAAGDCDQPEYCNGISTNCPADTFQPSSSNCRPASGRACDIDEYCTGFSKPCPDDAFRPDAIMCRASTDDCDEAEYCTGSAAACPPDVNHCRLQIAAGEFHTCAITSAGTLYCWGRNSYGQLGDDSTTTRRDPVQVGAAVNWMVITAGSYHTCGVNANGEAYCWGYNYYGEVGDGTTTNRTTPVLVMTL